MTPDDMVLTPRGLRYGGLIYPCVIGRGGVRSDKHEGDGATPAGNHRIVGLYWRPDRLARPAPWAQPIRLGDLWSDDPNAPEYNRLVRAPYMASHEAMRRADPLYDLVLVTDWNWPNARPGMGSCIFLHQWRRKGFPTAGCIAFRRDHLISIAATAAPGTRLIVPETLRHRQRKNAVHSSI